MNFKRGFSLIEVSVSLLILSVAVMSVYQTLSSTSLSIFSLENRVIAREIANNRISFILLISFVLIVIFSMKIFRKNT